MKIIMRSHSTVSISPKSTIFSHLTEKNHESKFSTYNTTPYLRRHYLAENFTVTSPQTAPLPPSSITTHRQSPWSVSVGYSLLANFVCYTLPSLFFSLGSAWSFWNYILHLKVLIFYFLWLVGCSDLSFQFKPKFAFIFWLSGPSLFLWKIIFCESMVVDDTSYVHGWFVSLY